ncbi:hypothetical protein GCM10027157_18710 [Corynebacterium aquatimens]
MVALAGCRSVRIFERKTAGGDRLIFARIYRGGARRGCARGADELGVEAWRAGVLGVARGRGGA